MIRADVIKLEGMAMNGLLESIALIECKKPAGWKKIVARDVEGNLLETSCMEPDSARRNFMVLTLYAKRWGRLVNLGGEAEGPAED